MNILAIDTAAELCAACVFDAAAGLERGRAVRDLGKGHAEHVMTVVTEALEAAGLGYGDLGAVGVSVGPGSFTGVRVGVSAARGFALALAIPAIGVSTLEALAAEARARFPGRSVLAAIRGGRDGLYVAAYDAAGEIADGPALLAADAVAAEAARARPVLCGNASGAVAEAAGGSFDIASCSATADVGVYARLAAERPAGEKPVPLYLRAPDARPQAGFALPLKGR